MALPQKPFMFNFNAKNYSGFLNMIIGDDGGQDFALLLTGDKPVFNSDEDSLTLSGNTYYLKKYGSANENPYNRSSEEGKRTFTFIYKTDGFDNQSANIFSNRGQFGYNFMVRGAFFHTMDSGALVAPIFTRPEIIAIRVNEDLRGVITEYDTDGNLVFRTSNDINWGGPSETVSWFTSTYDGYNATETFQGKFYWMYCSMDFLEDDEVIQVIDYNEGRGSSFKINVKEYNASYAGGSFNIGLESKGAEWTAESPEWISLSSYAGNDDTTITATIRKNYGSKRTGEILFKSGEETLVCKVTQGDMSNMIPINNIFRNGRRIN